MVIKKLLIGLISEYQEILYRIAKTRLDSKEDVFDVVQDTLVSAYKALPTLKNEKYFKTWIIKILINKCNDFYYGPKKYDVSFENIEQHKVISAEDFTNDFGIDYLISSLNKEEQTILTLYYSEGYSEKEISKILNIKYSTIRTKIKRAKEKIALKLDMEVS